MGTAGSWVLFAAWNLRSWQSHCRRAGSRISGVGPGLMHSLMAWVIGEPAYLFCIYDGARRTQE